MHKLPTALSLPVLCGAVKRIIAYSKHFRYKQQRQNFIYLIISILFLKSCLLKSVQSTTSISKKWTACLSHFLQSNTWDTQTLDAIALSLFAKHHAEIRYIALDWTALIKTGKSFEWRCDVYDGRDGKIKNGFPLLTALGIDEGKNFTLPLCTTLASWNAPGFKSENCIITACLDQVKERLQHLQASSPETTVLLLDRGFYRTTVIEHLLKQELPFIMHADSDITIMVDDEKTEGRRKTKLEKLKAGYYEGVYIEHLKTKLTVAVYYDKDKKDKQYKKMIVVTNLKGQSKEQLKEAYGHRWAIEEYFKELKSNYDLENFRVRKFKAIERIVKLVMLAQAIVTDSLIENAYWVHQIRTILMEFLYYGEEITKKGISLLREIAFRLAHFGRIDGFRLRLAQVPPFPT